jgi:dTDP-4-dehydrorhamnose reductase
MTTAELSRPAARPAYSVLATERREAIYLPDWQEGLASYLTERVAA